MYIHDDVTTTKHVYTLVKHVYTCRYISTHVYTIVYINKALVLNGWRKKDADKTGMDVIYGDLNPMNHSELMDKSPILLYHRRTVGAVHYIELLYAPLPDAM